MEIINVTEQSINVNATEDIVEVCITDEIIEVNVTEAVVNIVTQTGAYPLPSNVFSVFGRVGNVVGQAGDYTTSIVAEGTNLYYTNARSRAAISENITGINYDNTTGVFSMASGYSLPSDSIQATWTTAYNDKINSASVSGTTTKTLTLNQQDGGTITTSWTDDNTDAVTSVFGRTGAVTAQSGDYTSLQVTENTNLYYTDQRARYAISGDTNSGVVYQNTTGIIALDDIPNTSLLNDKVTINSKNVSLGGSLTLTTTDVAEGTNLYFTNARAQNALTYGDLTSGDLDVSGGTAAVIGAGASMTLKTVNSNVGQFGSSTAIPVVTVNGKGLVTAMSTTAVSIPSGALNFIGDVTGSGTTGSDTTLTLKTVNSNVGEYGDSVTIPTVTVNAKGLVTAASETAIPTASGSTTGLLTSTDWTTFNNKQAALNGTGFVKASGTTISYDNSTYLTSVSGITAGGELSGTYPNPTLVNSAVTGKVLTGVNITGGTIQDTDSILTAFGKVQNQINGLIGGSIYKGTWNATTNTPTITSGVGTKGDYYIVSVSGTTTIDGISDWNVGDWIIYDGTAYQQVDNTDAVVSVNGYTGAVSLTTSDISEGTNQYFTTTRARGSVSAGTGISYNSTSGVITNTITQYTDADARAALSFTAGSGAYNSSTGVITIPTNNNQITNGAGYITTSDLSGLVPYTGATANLDLGTFDLTTDIINLNQLKAIGSGGLNIYSNSGTHIALLGGGGGAGTTFYGGIIGTSASFTTSGGSDTFSINHSSGSGIALNITKAGNGEGLYINKTSGSGNAVTIIGTLNATTLVKNGGTSSEFLKADGSVDSTSYQELIASGTTSQYYRGDKTFQTLDTSVVTENTNLYFTDARARAAISLTTTGSNGASTYNSTTGALNIPTYTLAGLGGINLTSLSATSPLLYDNTTGVFSIQQASGSQAGFLSSADWTTFNNKVPSTRTLSINGTAYDLSADRSWTITPNINATTTQDYTATAAQTTFTVTGGYTVGQLAVFYNGSKLAAAEFTATDGTTFVLATACQVNDIVQAVVSVTGGGIGGSGTTNYLAKFSASGVIGDSAITDNGTTVTLVSRALSGTSATFSSSVTTNGSFANIVDNNTISPQLYLVQTGGNTFSAIGINRNNGTGIATGLSSALVIRSGDATAFPIQFATANNIRMTISSGGNVGIGTSNPDNLLVVSGGTGSMRLEATSANRSAFVIQNTGNALYMGIENSSGTYFGATAYSANFQAGNYPMIFWTNSTERMRITSGGSVLIGTTTVVGSDSKLNVVGPSAGPTFSNDTSVQQTLLLWNKGTSGNNLWVEFHVGSSLGTKGSIDYNRGSNVTRYNTTSDANLKNIIGDSDKQKSIDILNSTRIREYSWKQDENNKPQIGVIAQELYETYKGAVSVGSDEELFGTEDYKNWAVDKTAFTYHLIAGWQKHEQLIQEQQAQIDELKQLINK